MRAARTSASMHCPCSGGRRIWPAPATGGISRPGHCRDRSAAFGPRRTLAAAQLHRLWARHGAGRAGVLYALPPGWTGEQRGELLALSAALGMPVLALADAAVAASRHEHPGRELLLPGRRPAQPHAQPHPPGRHRRPWARQPATARAFPPSASSRCCGSAMEILARRFVECSRFDPLHDSATEQALFDQLPGWLARLARDAEVKVELATRSGTFGAVIQSADFRARMARACEPLLQKLRARVAERGPHVLQVHHRLADLPGVLEALLRLPDTAVHVLAPGRGGGWPGQPRRRPAPAGQRPGGDHRPALGRGTGRTPLPSPRLPPVPQVLPTHLLAGHRAYRLGDGPFRIGSELGPGRGGRRPRSRPPRTVPAALHAAPGERRTVRVRSQPLRHLAERPPHRGRCPGAARRRAHARLAGRRVAAAGRGAGPDGGDA